MIRSSDAEDRQFRQIRKRLMDQRMNFSPSHVKGISSCLYVIPIVPTSKVVIILDTNIIITQIRKNNLV